ncbi:hypothetical protein Csp1_23430 [Corynebacterium provencense]|uniref:DUF4440 domain-containing protein n=1 Tax=Corynebacterium provencense TaxID=1737425 RepID=A0A2Z3Z0H1_9CORY|nr:hypothetical protein Csp1_23430 [Corynebacterium provencense]
MRAYAKSAVMASVIALCIGGAGFAAAQENAAPGQDNGAVTRSAVPAVPTHDEMRAQISAVIAKDATDDFISANIANPAGVPAMRAVGDAMRKYPQITYKFIGDPVVNGKLMTQRGQFIQVNSAGQQTGSKPEQDFIYQVKDGRWVLSNDMVCLMLDQASMSSATCPVTPGEDLPVDDPEPTESSASAPATTESSASAPATTEPSTSAPKTTAPGGSTSSSTTSQTTSSSSKPSSSTQRPAGSGGSSTTGSTNTTGTRSTGTTSTNTGKALAPSASRQQVKSVPSGTVI